MYMDFHTHGKLAKKLPFSEIYTEWLFGEAKEAGLEAICLTEHFNTIQFEDLYEYLKKIGKRENDCYVLENGLKIFTGMETDIKEGGHILSIGPIESIIELNRKLEPYKTPDNFLPFNKLMDLFSNYPVIVGAAHPFREGGHIPEIDINELKRLDFIDMNGKDIAIDKEGTQKKIYEFSKQIGKPVVSGSDTHQSFQYGCIKTKFYGAVTEISDLYERIKSGDYNIEIDENAGYKVRTASILKKALKEIHFLGGDYVSILKCDEIV